MEIDGRDCAKCKKSKLRDMIGIIEMFNDNRTKVQIVSSPTYEKAKRKCEGGRRCSSLSFLFSRERKSSFSLDSRAIGSSDSFEARRKVVLRGEGNA